MTNPDDPAMPYQVDQIQRLGNWPGLTKREEFAKAAMQGHLSNPYVTQEVEKLLSTSTIGRDGRQLLAEWSVADADALIAELNKEKP